MRRFRMIWLATWPWSVVVALSLASPEAPAQRVGTSQYQSTRATPATSGRRTPQQARNPVRRGGLNSDDEPRVGPSAEGIEARGSFDEEGFIGRDAEDVRETFDRLAPRERRGAMFDMMLENLNEMRRAQERWQEQRRRPPPVRVRLQPVFRVPRPTPAVVEAQLQRRLEGALAEIDAAARVELIDGVAILQGQAATARDRQVAEQIVLLQPGVTRVDNRIVVSEVSARDR